MIDDDDRLLLDAELVRTVRPSALARAASCPATQVESQGHPSCGSEDTALGNALDLAVSLGVRGETIDPPALLAEFGAECDLTEFAHAIRWAMAWIIGNVPNPRAQVKAGFGTADIVGLETADDLSVDLVYVVDVKKTEHETEHPLERLQTADYLAAKMRELRARRGVVTLLYPFQQKAVVSEEMTAESIAAYAESIARIRERAAEQFDLPIERRSYTPGAHCGYCPGAPTCEARNSSVVSARNLLVPFDGNGRIELTRETLTDAWSAKAMLEGVIKDLKAASAILLPQGEEQADARGKLRWVDNRRAPKLSVDDVYDAAAALGMDVAAIKIRLDEKVASLPTTNSPYLRFFGSKAKAKE